MVIVGAGLAGLIAGHVFKNATLIEAGPQSQTQHKAVLRFRTADVGNATGIEFRKVRVRKAIFLDGRYVDPCIAVANWYAKKVIGKLIDRSIWNIEPCDRFVAPEDFIPRMVDNLNGRVLWDTNADFEGMLKRKDPETVISTIPMPTLAKALGEQLNEQFDYAPITVRRWRVKGADVFQTVYFPDPRINLYRASITGDLLIAEYVNRGEWPEQEQLFAAFGLQPSDVESIDSSNQRYGKIAPIDEQRRREFVFSSTLRHGIYSLGRFATWRNILLDDVLHDAHVIKGLIGGDRYGARRAAAKPII